MSEADPEQLAPLDPRDWTIRPPLPGGAEREAVSGVVRSAFGAADPEEGRTVAALVERLRGLWDEGRGFELVAVAPDGPVGHVGLTRAYVDAVEELHHVLVLSPLAVDPAWQGRGIGQALVRGALEASGAAGYRLVFLEGAPSFYPKLGFRPGVGEGFAKPSARIPDAAFMVARTGAEDDAGAPPVAGALVYPEVFWETDTVGLRGELLRALVPELFGGPAAGD
ncbi:GNAT family N-acetyltransferase [Zafaria sp. Z1313]|uniref:GNAT family N-acetyltransferase n=1 Tax=unclassified Zafaria TaxID=2828765 RepID=UPI002E798789|nr:N-acetyltransferase [Zafaria sp. J156]MEE1622046.1 N-acetyltransferase [Zafaria sp. J156]